MPRRVQYLTQYRVLGKNGGEYFRCNDIDTAKLKYSQLREKRRSIAFRLQTRRKRIGEYGNGDAWEPWQEIYGVLTDAMRV